MTDPNGRPIVAELGRPETPEETWARKDAARTARRQHQTAFNLVIALIASLGIVLFLVAVVVRPDTTVDRTVDYQQIAADAKVDDVTLAAPGLPDGFSANRADFASKTTDGVDVWTVGFVTPDKQYLGLQQGIDANASWVSNQLDQRPANGTRTIDDTEWTVYDRRSEGTDAGNHAYSLVSRFGKNTIVLSGTADDKSFRTVATAVDRQLSE
ncbi:DUF4245 domain-containing protein [Curtobacterium sp. VKM Ac-1376]|uniref:DUF4245 domain-containing protein n=1 Tax=Curtobacterium sp. VKM Ac-1376 TaxID=123312 RepID=UPI00188C9336|nr:DUF4245 domain-containing protein [Curtobacterium sp. VKM Ac-1376]MBF4616391.1 DUF4245 domain-containing protein [Curtobacterium sp. VKM Ac-1376]